MSVQLSKGQSVDLRKADGDGLRRVLMGAGWDAAKSVLGRRKDIDLDASLLLLNASADVIDQVWFRQLRSSDGAIQHSGDNRTGRGEGDDETITVDLNAVTPAAHTLVFVINSYSGDDFSKVRNAYCRLVDLDRNEELARYSLSQSGPHTAQVMAKLQRSAGGWTMTAIGHLCQGRTIRDLIPIVSQLAR